MDAFFVNPARIMQSIAPGALSPLVPAATQARLLALAEGLTFPSQTVCYETRLAPGDDRVDLALCLLPGFATNRSVEDLALGGRIPTPAWRRCARFLSAWGERGSRLDQVPFVCLALDVVPDEAEPQPCLSVCVDREFFGRRFGMPMDPPSFDQVCGLLRVCHEQLFCEPPPEMSIHHLDACMRSPDIRARHVSFMLARHPSAIKFDLSLPVSALGRFLRHVARDGRLEFLASQVRDLMPCDGSIQLNLPLFPEFAPALEVEFLVDFGQRQFASAGAHVLRDERSLFLERLVALRLADREKADVLQKAWEEPLLVDKDGRRVAQSWYVKVCLRAEGLIEAKAYFALIPRMGYSKPWS